MASAAASVSVVAVPSLTAIKSTTEVVEKPKVERRKQTLEVKETTKKKGSSKKVKKQLITDIKDGWQCGKCGDEFLEADSKMLECEVCEQHFCSRCLDLSDDLYALLVNRADLHWYCKSCEAGALISIKTDKEISIRCEDYFKVMDSKINGILDALNQKVDSKQLSDMEVNFELVIKNLKAQWSTEMNALEKAVNSKCAVVQQKVSALETKNAGIMVELAEVNKKLTGSLLPDIDTRLAAFDKKLSDLVNLDPFASQPRWSEVVAKSDLIDSRLTAMSSDVQTLQQQTTTIQQDRAELEEQNKRKNCVIMHGLKEPVSNDKEADRLADLDGVEGILHCIGCDSVSVNACYRLGKVSHDSTGRPRPVKLILASEGQKEQVLKSAKNLKGKGNDMASVYIHQDLTPKQREMRHQLVQQLKERRAKGEINLIIIDNKIVTRNPRPSAPSTTTQ